MESASVAATAFAFSFWMVLGSGYGAVYQGTALLLAGIPVYLAVTARAAPLRRRAAGARPGR
ncbi:hypothetical protein ACFFMN_40235 [Planobispora siamensis]|uniref:Uncharacterized protein n=1 Tax=Planobispora siamensis TaxID=936338 RepID=A0A8J3WN04_9ACTN|nr:hypothetical protein [Planobispora siamensis]GIH95225.1 hypothetical protein Psi01_58550 [Planobispora siamensis]